MIAKTVSLAVGLVVLYVAVVPPLARELPVNRQLTQWESNRASIENVWRNRAQARTVLVGSSITAALGEREGWMNLGMSGGSVLTGLAFLERAKIVPGWIFVELNVVNRPIEEALLSQIFVPFLSVPWISLSEGLAVGDRPSVVAQRLTQFAGYLRNRLRPTLPKTRPQKETAPPRDVASQPSVNAENIRREMLSHRTDEDALEAHLRLLEGFLVRAQARGTRILLHRVPEPAQFASSAAMVQRDQAIARSSIPDRFRRIPIPLASDWEWSDAIHLNASSASRYLEQISAALTPRAN